MKRYTKEYIIERDIPIIVNNYEKVKKLDDLFKTERHEYLDTHRNFPILIKFSGGWGWSHDIKAHPNSIDYN